MPETPSGYLLDVDVEWGFSFADDFTTEVETYRSGREQRRIAGGSDSFRRWSMKSIPENQSDRQVIYDFLKTKKGRAFAFYFWRPDPAKFVAYNLNQTLSAAVTITLPFKQITIGQFRVAGLAKTFNQIDNAGPGGETILTPTSGTWTGATEIDVTLGRERVIVRNFRDSITQEFVADAADLHSKFELILKEVR